MTAPTEWVVLCEGYDDRAFLAGWLGRLGWTDLAPGRDGPAVRDPWGLKVTGGALAFETPGGLFARIRPCGGVEGVFKQARILLEGRGTRSLSGLVLLVAADESAAIFDPTAPAVVDRFDGLIDRVAPEATPVAPGYVRVDDRVIHMACIVLASGEPARADLPEKETLERLVCAAIAAAYPKRSDAVAGWLAGRPEPPSEDSLHKAHAWSHMAGWYPGHGCDDFYRAVWRDEEVSAELDRIIDKAIGRSVLEAAAMPGEQA